VVVGRCAVVGGCVVNGRYAVVGGRLVDGDVNVKLGGTGPRVLGGPGIPCGINRPDGGPGGPGGPGGRRRGKADAVRGGLVCKLTQKEEMHCIHTI